MRTWVARSLTAFALLGLAAVPAIAQQIQDMSAADNEIAQVSAAPISLVVESRCAEGAAMFRISNSGAAWPRLGTLALVKLDGTSAEIISKRQMRFAAGQKASFRVKNATGETYAILIEPSWYDRPRQFDAPVTCD